MVAKETKDQQVKRVVEGVALGVLAHGVLAVTSAKFTLELNFNHAWRRWSRAAQFPSIGGHDPGNQFWIGVSKSEGRRGVVAAWQSGRWAVPYLLDSHQDWTVDECLDLIADERASAEDWKELGGLYVAKFKPEDIRHVQAE